MFERYGFTDDGYEQWIKGDLVIFEGLGMDSDKNFTIYLYTLCKEKDIVDSTKIIFRGEFDEMENYLKKINREKKLKGLINE